MMRAVDGLAVDEIVKAVGRGANGQTVLEKEAMRERKMKDRLWVRYTEMTTS